MKFFIAIRLTAILLLGFTSKEILVQPPVGLVEKEYIKEIPFTFDYRVPIIKATIKGNEYHFLFDTGMPTALSKDIIKEYHLKSTQSGVGRDVNGNTSNENYVTIDEIKVGGISFKNIETLAVDLKNGFELKCLNIDGVIGNNLILNAIWEIDYKNKIIRLTNTKSLLNIADDTVVLNFKTNKKRKQNSPKIDLVINNKKIKSVKFDTGSNGGLNMPFDFFSKVLDPKKSIESFGSTSASLYGKGKSKKYIDANVRSIKMGSIQLNDQIVSFNSKTPLVGSRFLKGYKIVIDYKEHKIYMTKQQNQENFTIENFGFLYSVVDNKAIVSKVYKSAKAYNKEIRLGDEIIKINDLNVAELIRDDACSFMFNSPLKEMNTVVITLLRNGKTVSVILEKEVLLN